MCGWGTGIKTYDVIVITISGRSGGQTCIFEFKKSPLSE